MGLECTHFCLFAGISRWPRCVGCAPCDHFVRTFVSVWLGSARKVTVPHMGVLQTYEREGMWCHCVRRQNTHPMLLVIRLRDRSTRVWAWRWDQRLLGTCIFVNRLSTCRPAHIFNCKMKWSLYAAGTDVLWFHFDLLKLPSLNQLYAPVLRVKVNIRHAMRSPE